MGRREFSLDVPLLVMGQSPVFENVPLSYLQSGTAFPQFCSVYMDLASRADVFECKPKSPPTHKTKSPPSHKPKSPPIKAGTSFLRGYAELLSQFLYEYEKLMLE